MQLKRLQLLVDAAPAVSKVVVLLGLTPLREDAWESAAQSLGVRVSYMELARRPVLRRDDFEPAFARAVAEGADALLVRPGTEFQLNADLIVALAARHRLPAIYGDRLFVDRGGLMAYGRGTRRSSGARRSTSTASCAGRSRPTCRSSWRRATTWSSTGGPRGRSASPFRPRSSLGSMR